MYLGSSNFLTFSSFQDLIDCQGPSCDVGGYYKVDPVKADVAMRPSKIFNDLMDKY